MRVNCDITASLNHQVKGALFSLVERKIKLTPVRKLKKKQADLVAEVAINLLNPYEEKAYSITADNGQALTMNISKSI
jgi:IS30 family transposase